ncbi:MAG TPA: cob(I)yrinic acid a,c-diamide adenosyltransferase [Desulfopila sp.]|nr:cob(I)yrinic acid a,c-diamide adenosyltransferase [Desulfopila sp.]
MKIYTGTGDKGRTSLFSGERLKKNADRVSAYGTIDELCSFIGVVIAALPQFDDRQGVVSTLEEIQASLFKVGAILATSAKSADAELLQPFAGKEATAWLERRIDAMEGELEELRSFILPGGHPAAAWAQVSRAVCRRAEREVLTCLEAEDGYNSEAVLGYVNRLSDYFFVLGRYLNTMTGTAEKSWHG